MRIIGILTRRKHFLYTSGADGYPSARDCCENVKCRFREETRKTRLDYTHLSPAMILPVVFGKERNLS